MKKKTKVLSLILALVVFASIFAIAAAASTAQPYGSYSTKISLLRNSATAKITKCSCTPVDNHLEVWFKVQYRSGDSYLWLPSETTYYYDLGDDIAEASKTIQVSKIQRADALFWAKCGSGPMRSYALSDT